MLLRRCNRWALIVDTKNLSNNRHSKKKRSLIFLSSLPLKCCFLFVYIFNCLFTITDYELFFFVCIHILIYVRTTTKNYKQTAVMYKLLPCLVITLFERKSCLQKSQYQDTFLIENWNVYLIHGWLFSFFRFLTIYIGQVRAFSFSDFL